MCHIFFLKLYKFALHMQKMTLTLKKEGVTLDQRQLKNQNGKSRTIISSFSIANTISGNK